jgi:hypothetical protein
VGSAVAELRSLFCFIITVAPFFSFANLEIAVDIS